MQEVLTIIRNPVLRAEVHRILASRGLEITGVTEGGKALRLLDVRSFDLVIADTLVRLENGLEVIREIATRFPGQSIIALSGSSLTRFCTYQTFVSELGVNGFLAAPFDPRDFSSMTQRVLRWGQRRSVTPAAGPRQGARPNSPRTCQPMAVGGSN